MKQPPARFKINDNAHGLHVRRRQSHFLLKCCCVCWVAGNTRVRPVTPFCLCYLRVMGAEKTDACSVMARHLESVYTFLRWYSFKM